MADYMITGIVCAGLVIITAMLLSSRGVNLIAGFNTLSKTEKELYGKPALCMHMALSSKKYQDNKNLFIYA